MFWRKVAKAKACLVLARTILDLRVLVCQMLAAPATPVLLLVRRSRAGAMQAPPWMAVPWQQAQIADVIRVRSRRLQ